MSVETTIERLALTHGRVHVDEGFTDGLVRATTPNGAEHLINPDGVIVKVRANRTVDWS